MRFGTYLDSNGIRVCRGTQHDDTFLTLRCTCVCVESPVMYMRLYKDAFGTYTRKAPVYLQTVNVECGRSRIHVYERTGFGLRYRIDYIDERFRIRIYKSFGRYAYIWLQTLECLEKSLR